MTRDWPATSFASPAAIIAKYPQSCCIGHAVSSPFHTSVIALIYHLLLHLLAVSSHGLHALFRPNTWPSTPPDRTSQHPSAVCSLLFSARGSAWRSSRSNRAEQHPSCPRASSWPIPSIVVCSSTTRPVFRSSAYTALGNPRDHRLPRRTLARFGRQI